MEALAQANPIDIARLLDDGRFSRRQVVVVVLCGLMLMLDGYDGMEIAYVAPSLARLWHLTPATLSLIFTGSGISAILGSLIIGPLADRHGRRLMMLGGTVVMGAASLMGALASGPMEFLTWRLVCGLGLAAVMPNAIALGAEFAPARVRSLTVIAFYSGYAVGASIGAGLSAQLIPAYGWQIVLIIGGAVPVAVALLSLPVLPESLRFLALRRPRSPTIRAELGRIDRRWRFGDDTVFTTTERPATRTPVRDLFREGRAPVTLLLWLIFTMNIMELIFLSSWTPTLLHNSGIALDRALNVSMVMQIGAILGGLVTAFGMDRLGPPAALLPAHVLGVFAVAAFGISIGAGPTMFIVAALMGAGVMGTQNGMNGFAAILYPTAMRATGVGMTLGVGRIGSILGPILGGAVVAMGLAVPSIYAIAAVPPLISTAAIFTLWRMSRAVLRRRSETLTAAAGE